MYNIGIDLGGTNIAVGLVDENGKIILKDSVPTLRERSYEEIIKDMAMLTLKVIRDAGVDPKDVGCIGVGSPGIPNNKEGTIVRNYNLNFHNTPVRSEMRKYIDLPVYIENDANCAALAESVAGAAKGVEHSVAITLGTGVGGGLVINGKIFSGFNYAASEIGHMVIVIDGAQCTCGRKGCWEAYSSATALIRQTREAAQKHPESAVNQLANGDLSAINAKTAFDAMRQGDEVGKQLVNEYIKYLAEGLTNVINTFQPEIIVLGGGVSKEGDYLLMPLQTMINERTFSLEVPQTQIKVAQMGNDAGIVGAAMLGR